MAENIECNISHEAVAEKEAKRYWRVVFLSGRSCTMIDPDQINADIALKYARNQFSEQAERVE